METSQNLKEELKKKQLKIDKLDEKIGNLFKKNTLLNIQLKEKIRQLKEFKEQCGEFELRELIEYKSKYEDLKEQIEESQCTFYRSGRYYKFYLD